MKANGAPEKIYISVIPSEFGGNKTITCDKDFPNAVEYTRTDVLIEKVKSFLNKKDDRDSYTIGYIKKHLKEIIKEVGL